MSRIILTGAWGEKWVHGNNDELRTWAGSGMTTGAATERRTTDWYGRRRVPPRPRPSTRRARQARRRLGCDPLELLERFHSMESSAASAVSPSSRLTRRTPTVDHGVATTTSAMMMTIPFRFS